jgi:hypothetical protein
MNAYSIDCGSLEFWNGLERRLYPLLPDLNAHRYAACMAQRAEQMQGVLSELKCSERELKEAREADEKFCKGAWMDDVERLFPRASFVAAATHRELGSAEKPWFIVELLEPASRLVGDEDWVIAADSFVEGVGYLVDRCTDVGVFPDDLSLEGELLTLHLGGDVFATVGRAPNHHRNAADDLRRARSTLLGLRKGQRTPATELLHRIQSWPGMKRLTLDREDLHESFMLPEPGEWLLSAEQLCRVAGISDPDQSLQQRVASAIFDRPSWNHLAGGLAEGATRLVAPWYVTGDNADRGDAGTSETEVFVDVFDAFVSYMARARRCASRWETIVFDGSHSIGAGHLPAYWLRRGSEADKRWQQPSLDLAPCTVAKPAEETLDKTVMLVAEGQDGLRDLFMIGRGNEERFAIAQRLRNIVALAQEGGWRFGWMEEGRESHIEIAFVDASGQVAVKTLAKARKTELVWFSDIGQHALIYFDAGKRSPIALLGSLSKSTETALRRRIGRDHGAIERRPLEMAELSDEDRRAMAKLMQTTVPLTEYF